MALDKARIPEWSRRMILSKMRILASHPFYGLLLAHVQFSMDETIDTACTDGLKIWFSPDFLDSLNDDELDFVMMHEILHIALQHCLRYNEYDPELFNIACDIVVNSNIKHSFGDDVTKIQIGGEAFMHLTPENKEGYLYTAEEVYEMLPKVRSMQSQGGSSNNKNGGSQNGADDGKGDRTEKGKYKKKKGTGGKPYANESFDDHSRWSSNAENDELSDAWGQRVADAARVVEIEDPSNTRGTIPAGAERMLKEMSSSQLDWRSILNSFVQEEIVDYSFSPPDRRFNEFDFFLPDYNVPEELVKNILFMVDTSGSMSDKMIGECYSEICSAIAQFDGRLEGYLGFFDAKVIKPVPFSSIDELKIIRPYGGGGTSFECIFNYVNNNWEESEPPASIIILTDGYAPFPEENIAKGIPVLWIINNKEVTPPWGKIARIESTDKGF